MTTEPGEPQESVPEAAAHSTPKQVHEKKGFLKQFAECDYITSSPAPLCSRALSHFLCPQGGEGGPSAEDSTSHLSSGSRITRSPARNPLSFRTMQVKVSLLDGSLFTCTVEVRQLRVRQTGVWRLETAS